MQYSQCNSTVACNSTYNIGTLAALKTVTTAFAEKPWDKAADKTAYLKETWEADTTAFKEAFWEVNTTALFEAPWEKVAQHTRIKLLCLQPGYVSTLMIQIDSLSS